MCGVNRELGGRLVDSPLDVHRCWYDRVGTEGAHQINHQSLGDEMPI